MDAQNPDPIDSAQDADDARFASMRAEPRDTMLLLATLRRASGAEVAIKVRNLSGGGMLAEGAAGLLKGELVEVELRGIGIVPSRVAWIAGSRAGIAFDHAVDHKLARRPVGGGPQPQLVKASRNMWRPGLR
ncbi:PilZ domain-containing protein [Sphingomonas bacterium]|uniref:PilZ domain-containing protein n=1 Tax=Sphingomonas bacterium TaxID=1895847 RepID=UPI0015752D3E|nr:PilZ domain-containing protein [Sphingomonas bacterium]